MKFTNFILLLIFCFFSCKSDDCTFSAMPVPPAGYTINKIGLIEDDNNPAGEFQMLNSTIGYALKDRRIFKTANGGATWTSSTIPFDFTLESMIFTDENTGYISHRGDDSGAFILKTTDGGTTWEDLAFPEFPIYFRKLKHDTDNNLYATLGGFGEYTGLVKSVDNGFSWSEIYTTNSPFLSLLTIVDDRIYFKESSDKLQIADLEGTILKTILVEGNDQLSVVDENNIIVVNQYQVHKTVDGGANWTKIFDNKARVIDFSNSDGLLMLVNKEFCGDNLSELSAFEKRAPDSSVLEKAEPMVDFEVWSLGNVQKVAEGHYLLQHENNIFELKKL